MIGYFFGSLWQPNRPSHIFAIEPRKEATRSFKQHPPGLEAKVRMLGKQAWTLN